MSYYLGVDVGATKSHALIADEACRAVGFGSSGPGNYEVVGWEGLEATLQKITRQALEEAGLSRGQIAGAGFGVAGYDWPSERQPTLDAIATLGLDAPTEVVNDSVIGLLAGASDRWGIAIVAGTGENCWGVDRQRNYGRLTGNGLLMGEYGGAGTIVFKAIRAVARDWSKRGPPTRLSQVFMELTGAPSLDELLEGIALGRYDYGPDLARVIFQVAEQGDQVALGVIRWAALGLADMVCGVIRQLSFEQEAFDVVLSGSVFKGGPLLVGPMKEAIWETAPGARFVPLTTPPVVGGVLLGMEQAGVDGYRLRDRLHATARGIIDDPDAC